MSRDDGGLREMLQLRRITYAIAALALLLGSPTFGDVAAQEATPVPEETQESTAPSEGELNPHMVIAQGLAIFDVVPAIWRVTEIDVPRGNAAEQISGDVSFTLQVVGLSVIRNDVTAKRALLSPGEAYFMSAIDPYTRRAGGSGDSKAWIFEYLPADAPDDEAPGTILFKSDPIEDFPEGARDLELIRVVLQPGDSADLPEHNGDALVMVTNGSVRASAGAGVSTLTVGQGLMVPGPLTVTNDGDEPAAYVVLAIGGRVRDPSDAANEETEAANEEEAAAEEEATEEPTAEATADPNDPDGDGLSNNDEESLGTDPENADTDGDGLSDSQEEGYTDPLNPDTDGDGTSDSDEEFIHGTDPNDPDSRP